MARAVQNCTLIELNIFGSFQRFCLSGQVSWNGLLWEYLNTNPPVVLSGSGSVKTASFQLPDSTLTINKALIENGIVGVFGRKASIKFYSGFSLDTAPVPVVQTVNLEFKGFVSKISAFGPLLGLELRAENYDNDKYPKFKITDKDFKYLIDTGTVERFNSDTFVVPGAPNV